MTTNLPVTATGEPDRPFVYFRKVLENRRLTDGQFRVFSVLMSFMGSGVCDRPAAELAEWAQMTHDATRKSLGQLARLGIITAHRRPGHPTAYRFPLGPVALAPVSVGTHPEADQPVSVQTHPDEIDAGDLCPPGHTTCVPTDTPPVSLRTRHIQKTDIQRAAAATRAVTPLAIDPAEAAAADVDIEQLRDAARIALEGYVMMRIERAGREVKHVGPWQAKIRRDEAARLLAGEQYLTPRQYATHTLGMDRGDIARFVTPLERSSQQGDKPMLCRSCETLLHIAEDRAAGVHFGCLEHDTAYGS